jgi:hypothetical protein
MFPLLSPSAIPEFRRIDLKTVTTPFIGFTVWTRIVFVPLSSPGRFQLSPALLRLLFGSSTRLAAVSSIQLFGSGFISKISLKCFLWHTVASNIVHFTFVVSLLHLVLVAFEWSNHCIYAARWLMSIVIFW